MARGLGLLGLVAAAMIGMPSAAFADGPVLKDIFPVGGGLCQAQSRFSAPALQGVFDRAWSVICRDAEAPVGEVIALHDGGAPAGPRFTKQEPAGLACDPPKQEQIALVGAVSVRHCRLGALGLSYRIVSVHKGRFQYQAQGLAAYQNAIDLALASVVTDRIVPGTVTVATLGDADAAVIARAQARTADPRTVLAQGYRSNNSGRYAEAAAYFAALKDTLDDSVAGPNAATAASKQDAEHEALINQALQRSDLGAFDDADLLFARAAAIPTRDPVQRRLRRNFLAIHRLNQGDDVGALDALTVAVDPPFPAIATGDAVTLSPEVAAAVNGAAGDPRQGTVRQETTLTPAERCQILDAQADLLRGVAFRLEGQASDARASIDHAITAMARVRDGRVVSLARLQAQALIERARAAEEAGQLSAADADFRAAVDLLALRYPETTALNGARAQYAAYLARHGNGDAAHTLYRQVIADTIANQTDLTGVANEIDPYFAMLAANGAKADAAAELFLAAQTIVRPGAATTFDQLSRALSTGEGQGSRLFRQSLSLGRDIERSRIALAQLRLAPSPDAAAIAAEEAHQTDLTAQKTAALAALAAFPQYRAVDKGAVTLADLAGLLRPGEAYYKLTLVGSHLYAVYVDQAGAVAFPIAIDAATLADRVAAIRESISVTVNGVQATYPFDVADARSLFVDLFGPVAARLASAKRLIFEPDGAMLELPPNLLIADQAGVDAYLARTASSDADAFDMRGVAWLGRDRAVSTALSTKAFRASRALAPSAGKASYIGFGENAPLPAAAAAALAQPLPAGAILDCRWPARIWGRPIAATELRDAAHALGDAGDAIVTGAAFTDQAVLTRADIGNYRIIHFATHGLVAPPRAGCPAQPALLTSVGGDTSDGLLDFSEIFRLRLDADLVILSACDTAAAAGQGATLAAGLTDGGNSALDGLVRAFIGAGGRAVIASHWPAPDEFDATRRLMTALFTVAPGTPVDEAMRAAAVRLMDDPQTSHPFYWSGFAIIGDGARPVTTGARAPQ
ncbi:CHAT domain-containing protein [Sphingomonas sp. GlSt437]|uniref:CHAT domain-containing protein n=1 Tax=Sphingomonas sp. GlSt437 TaxID=3389970 RepID=UPI003A86E273